MEYYTYNNKIYKFINNAKHKDHKTREWITTILYTDGEKIYTREAEEFYAKFKRLTNAPREPIIPRLNSNKKPYDF